MGNISVCKSIFPSYIQDNLNKEEQKLEVLTFHLQHLLKDVLEKTKCDSFKDVHIISLK